MNKPVTTQQQVLLPAPVATQPATVVVVPTPPIVPLISMVSKPIQQEMVSILKDTLFVY
jgi:hypothetical protein